VDADLTDTDRRPSRPWLAAVAVVLIIACLVPPLSALARRYLFVESIQFCVFALAAPAVAVLGAPGRLPPRRPRRSSFLPVLGYLIAWVVICLFWRLPPVLDQLARHSVLVAPEAVTLCAAGLGLWRELVRAQPLAARPAARPGPVQRACAAALAMWSIWAIAYVLGFASGSVVHGYDGGGSHLLTVDDQEITAFLLWAAAAAAFFPVVFTAALSWLREGPEAAGEPARPVPGTGVRGWGPWAR
jgi:hypothetical protein